MLKQKTVYFREEDLPLWEAIDNKAEWLHNALKPFPESNLTVSFKTDKEALDAGFKPKVIKTKEDAEKVVAPIKKVTYTPKTNWGA